MVVVIESKLVMRDRIADALRELIKRVTEDCKGQYDGEYEVEIQTLANVISDL